MRRANWFAVSMVSPALILVAVFFFIPMVLLVYMSFTQWPLFTGVPKWIGLANYRTLFTDPGLGQAVWFTLKFTIVLVPISFVVSYGLSMMLRRSNRISSIFRASFFLPVVIGFTAASFMASTLLTPGTGLINKLLAATGLGSGNTAWFAHPTDAFWAVIVLTIWKTAGTAMILLMAAAQAVPPEVIEASRMDGASWFVIETRIITPLIRRTIGLCLILSIGGTILTFDQFYALTKGGPGGGTTTVVLYTYTTSFIQFRLGYGAAISVVVSLVILLITAVQLRVLGRKED
ncbi:carbohydrate ABC transporter permease [Curtobacterium ammoniigenes]|uniref:carbohydrate ABC transporter permease n=1 Tax=Curtobacterium ammoniigenes TaxID=395387 RepID=UPI00082A7220|nr:sugar ABC transporter permease [Curtobacterium ammoniigenes]